MTLLRVAQLTLDDGDVAGRAIRLATVVRLTKGTVDVSNDARVVLLVGTGEADGLARREAAATADLDLGA